MHKKYIFITSLFFFSPNSFGMEPKTLVETIVLKKLRTYEENLYTAKGSHERASILAAYKKFFQQFEYGNEAIGFSQEKMLAHGTVDTEQSEQFTIRTLSTIIGTQLHLEYAITRKEADESMHSIVVSQDPLRLYEARHAAISPDGGYIALLVDENKRRFISIYKNRKLGDLEYIGSFGAEDADYIYDWKEKGIRAQGTYRYRCGLPLLNAMISTDTPLKVPQLTAYPTLQIFKERKKQEWFDYIIPNASNFSL
jgi:hypothetical protein